MSLSTDALLFSIVLMLFGVQTAFSVTEDGGTFLFAGVGLAVLALLGSIITSIQDADPGATGGENADR